MAKARPAWLPCLALAVAGHAWLLWPPRSMHAPPPGPPRAAPWQTRSVSAPTAPQPVAAPVHAAPPEASTALRRPVDPPRQARPAPLAPQRPPAAAPARPARAVPPTPARSVAAHSASGAAPAAMPRPPSPEPDASPGAPTQLPPSAALTYTVQGTARSLTPDAQSQLRWQRDAGHYTAEWTTAGAARQARTQRSEGAWDASGLQPERYADTARSQRAAHFDPAGGRIRFSANTPDGVWQAGAQDRLSGLLQLGALLAADPPRYPPGTVISLHTADAREAGAWHWRVEGADTVDVDGQPHAAIKLVRAPRQPYDAHIELWLAPALHHLPLRLRLTQVNGDVLDQRLQRVEWSP